MDIDILNQIKAAENLQSNLTEKFGLKYNPFPRSGIANLADSDEVTLALQPALSSTATEIVDYMKDALSSAGKNTEDKYLSLVILGEYGSGKTQTLMFIKALFGSLKTTSFKPYVVYIDNPGSKLSELIGEVISQIGIENFRRYLWSIFLDYMDREDIEDPDKRIRRNVLGTELNALSGRELSLFLQSINDKEAEFSWQKLSISYKYLIDRITFSIKASGRKQVEVLFKKYLTDCFLSIFKISSVAEYFYDIVTDNMNVTKSWDNIVTGNVKNIDKREVYLLKAIVAIVKKYLDATDFIILVDEFEDLAGGRIKDSDVDSYLRNLRTLIDREKNWCSVFAMNTAAYGRIQKIAAPLVSRIGDRIITLKPLTTLALVKTMIANYLDLARLDDEKKHSIKPFTDEVIELLLSVKETTMQGSPRFIVQSCYTLLQRASEQLPKNGLITREFAQDIFKDKILF